MNEVNEEHNNDVIELDGLLLKECATENACVKKFEVKISPDLWKETWEEELSSACQIASIPGFRKGKAPRPVVEKRFEEFIKKETINNLLELSLKQILKHTGKSIDSIDYSPEINIEEVEDDVPRFKFEFKFEFLPEISLPPYDKFEFEIPKIAVSEEEIEAELKRLQNRAADYSPIERSVEPDDLVVLSTEVFRKGEKDNQLSDDNFSVMLSYEGVMPEFKEALIGMSVGEEKQITLDLNKNQEGEADIIDLKFKVKEVKEKILPELNDELAKVISNCDSLEQLKKNVAEMIERTKQRELEIQKKQMIEDKLLALTEFEIPPSELEGHYHLIKDRINTYLEKQGLEEEAIKQRFEVINAEITEAAKRNAKLSLILQAIGEAEQIIVTEDDLEDYLNYLIQNHNLSPKEKRNILEDRVYRNFYREKLLEESAFSFVWEKTNFIEKE